MQYGLLVVAGTMMGAAMRRMALLRRQGFSRAARRLYQRAALVMGLAAWAAMAAQEAMLLAAGLLTWRTGLPLHLCSLMGVLLLPMLLSGSAFLWHVALFAGLPGGLLALLFPSVMQTPWPQWMRLAFHTLHCMVVLAPLLPLGLGRRPRPSGAAQAGLFLAVLALVDLAVNQLTGGNYLFLSLPAPGTPLSVLARHGVGLYRWSFGALCGLALLAEAAAVRLVSLRHLG